jgi:hypothetical protein
MMVLNNGLAIHRVRIALMLCILTGVAAGVVLPRGQKAADRALPDKVVQHPGSLGLRIGVETLRNPFWYEQEGHEADARRFWDKSQWDAALRSWVEDGYKAVLDWIEPWNRHAWQTFLVRHKAYPEARELSPQQFDRLREHVSWIFQRALGLGLKNPVFTYSIVSTRSFAKVHGLEQLPVSSMVDFRHTLPEMGPHFGVRNEQTRAFTEAPVAELLQLYPDLDGLYGAMGEAVPGKRSAWFQEAIVPGLKQSGRNPTFLVSNWMMPFSDFVEDTARREVYDNTWLAVHSNGEMFTDTKPYPTYARWLEQGQVPVVVEVMHHNLEHGFPFNSPQLAWEITHELRKFGNCRGILAWFSSDHPDSLMRRALAYYASHQEPYSDTPWVRLLEARFSDRQAAESMLVAFNASARIIPELASIAWAPHDLGTSRVLMLPYWYWTGEDARWSSLTSPSRGGVLLPLRHYAQVVAQLGPQFRGNSGADGAMNREHPGSQELIWGLGDYPIMPEAHMRTIRRQGDESFRAAEQALRTVKTAKDQATAICNYMHAYRDLAHYYEEKVLAATAALIYAHGGQPAERVEAERLADEAVEAYETAITFIAQAIDKQRGAIRGHWLGSQVFTLPQLIEREKEERRQLPTLFHWRQGGLRLSGDAKLLGRRARAEVFTPVPAVATPAPKR